MSRMVLTPELADLLTNDPSNKQAFVQEEGKCYAKYDEIRILESSSGHLEIQFYWKKVHMSSISADCDLSTGEVMNLLGVEGRTEITVTVN